MVNPTAPAKISTTTAIPISVTRPGPSLPIVRLFGIADICRPFVAELQANTQVPLAGQS